MTSLPAVVAVHNRYREPGGEDVVFDQQAALLEANGHRVTRLEATHDDVAALSSGRLATSLFWNRDWARRVGEAVERTGATVVHFHNTFPLVSPAAYYAARAAGAAVVQTLHNYRLICPGSVLLRDGRPCEDCVGSPLAWRSVVHGCYRGSRVESAGVAAMTAAHRLAGTWERRVDAYIALGPFARERFVAGGLPEERIHVLPNHLTSDPGVGEHSGDYLLYAGRLSPEKGIPVMVEAWRGLEGRIPLRIIGGGALGPDALGRPPGVEWLGPRPREEVLAAMRGARALVFPYLSYENSPMSVVEAFATGLPVIASRTPSSWMVEHGATGLLFDPGSAEALRATVERAWKDPAGLRAMGAAARREYERSHTARGAYERLTAIYGRARTHFLNTKKS